MTHEAEMAAPIQEIGICAHYMVLELPRILGCHPRGLPGWNVVVTMAVVLATAERESNAIKTC